MVVVLQALVCLSPHQQILLCEEVFYLQSSLNITMLNNGFQPICQAFYYLSQNSTRMLLPFSVHKYHTWAAPGAEELQLQVLSEQFNFIQQEVHVLSTHLWADHHLAEEVDFAPVRLVPKHHAALLHHSFLNYWSNLKAETEKAYCHPQKYARFGQKLFFALWSFFEVSESCTPCLSSSCLPQETLRLKPEGLQADRALRPWGSGTPRGIRARSKSLKSLLLAAFICHVGKLGLRFLSPRFRKVWTQAEHQLQPVKGTVYLLVLTRLSVITCTSWPLSHHICKAVLPRGHSPLKPCEPWAAREVRVMQY